MFSENNQRQCTAGSTLGNPELFSETIANVDHTYHAVTGRSSPVPSMANYINCPSSPGNSPPCSGSGFSFFRETDQFPTEITNIIEHGINNNNNNNNNNLFTFDMRH